MIEEVIRHLDAKGISNISTFAHENGECKAGTEDNTTSTSCQIKLKHCLQA